MKKKYPQFLFFILLSVSVFSQKQLDSLKQYYRLEVSEDERSRLINNNVLTPLRRKGSDSVLYVTQQNYSLAKRTKNREAIANAEAAMGATYIEAKNFAAALRFYYSALKGYEIVGNKSKVARSYLSISSVYQAMEDFKNAFDFINEALRLKESMGEKDRVYYGALIHQANTALVLKDYETSFNNSRISLKYFSDEPYIRVMIENSTGFYYNELFKEPNVDSLIAKLNIQKKQQLLDSSLYMYNKVLKTAKISKNRQMIAYANFGLGENEYLNKNYAEAIQYYKKSNSISQEFNNNNFDLLKRCYDGLYLSFSSLGNYEKALTNYQKFVAQNKKIQSDENKRALFKQNLVYEHEKELQKKEDEIKEQNRFIVLGSLSFVGLLVIILLFIKRRRLLKEKKLQQQFSQDLLMTQEKERKRFSEDLHDGLGQSLLLVKSQISLKNYEKSKELINSSIEEMRTIAKVLYPFQLNDVGISIALENLVLQLNDNYKDLLFFATIEDIAGKLTDLQEVNVFRIVQECLSNVIKHSGADIVKVSLTLEKSEVEILIEDNGKGFNFSKKYYTSDTLGLKTIQERTSFLKGSLKVDSKEGSGAAFLIKFLIAS
ncbi:MAG: sensor histidine kinase [Flavobacteriaceae bacterium]|nr:sensor histidine kinase [Flavobacteriaceae bacterium]